MPFSVRTEEAKIIVAGYHLVWTAYGWWLPNDPRGSWSDEVRVEPISDLGDPHYGRKAVQPPSAEVRRFYEEAKDLLKHPLLTFTDDDIVLLGQIFGQTIQANGYTCYAAAIMPDHVHLLIRRHRDWAETMIEKLQKAGRDAMIQAGRRAPTHPVWCGKGWKGFLNTRRDMERTAGYIWGNPRKAGRAEQRWEWVKVYDGWMPGYRGA